MELWPVTRSCCLTMLETFDIGGPKSFGRNTPLILLTSECGRWKIQITCSTTMSTPNALQFPSLSKSCFTLDIQTKCQLEIMAKFGHNNATFGTLQAQVRHPFVSFHILFCLSLSFNIMYMWSYLPKTRFVIKSSIWLILKHVLTYVICHCYNVHNTQLWFGD